MKKAYLLDDDLILEGVVENRHFPFDNTNRPAFVPSNKRCGFTYQIVMPEDRGNCLFYSKEEIKSCGYGNLPIIGRDDTYGN